MKDRNEVAIQMDLLLAQRIQKGDMLAFEELFNKNKGKVYKICLRILHNETDAEELCQKTFIQIWKKFHQYKGDAKLSTWIHRIAVNECLMYLRATKRHGKFSIDDDSVESAIGLAKHACQDKIELRLDLEKAISQLPNGYRKHLLGKDWFGLEHEELAAIHQCSTGNTKSQVAKARTKMKRLLNPGRKFKLKTA